MKYFIETGKHLLTKFFIKIFERSFFSVYLESTIIHVCLVCNPYQQVLTVGFKFLRTLQSVGQDGFTPVILQMVGAHAISILIIFTECQNELYTEYVERS